MGDYKPIHSSDDCGYIIQAFFQSVVQGRKVMIWMEQQKSCIAICRENDIITMYNFRERV